MRHVDQRAAVGLEAAANRQLFAEPLDSPCKDFLRLLVVELDGGLARLEFIHDEIQLRRFELFVELGSSSHD